MRGGWEKGMGKGGMDDSLFVGHTVQIKIKFPFVFFFFFFFFFFKKQPYIPSRKSSLCSKSMWKKELSMWEKRKTFKAKKKKLSAPGFEPGSPTLPRVGKGSSIT